MHATGFASMPLRARSISTPAPAKLHTSPPRFLSRGGKRDEILPNRSPKHEGKNSVVVSPASFGREPHEKSELPGQNEIVFPKPQNSDANRGTSGETNAMTTRPYSRAALLPNGVFFISLIAPSLIVTEVRLSSPWRRPRSLEPLSAIGQLNPPADNACFGALYPPR